MPLDNKTIGPSWLAVCTVIVLVCAIPVLNQLAWRGPKLLTDFASYYYGAKVAATGGNIYDVGELNVFAKEDGLLKNKKSIFPYLYPPVVASLLRPLVLFPRPVAELIWVWLSVGLVVAIGILALYFVTSAPFGVINGPDCGWRRRYVGLVATAILLAVLPARVNIQLGQINPLVLFAMLVFLNCWFCDRYAFIGGAFLSLAVLIKVTPVILLLLFVHKRSVRAFAGFVAGMVLIVLLTMVTGATEQWRWFFEFLPANTYGKAIPGLFNAGNAWNVSVAGFFTRILGESSTDIRAFTTISNSVLCGVVGLALLLARNDAGVKLLLLPLSVVMIVAAPYAWSQHVIYLLPGILYAVCHVWFTYSGGSRVLLIVGLAVLVLVGGNSMDHPYQMLFGSDQHVNGLLVSLNLYALIGLYVLGVGLFWRHRTQPKTSPCGDDSQVAPDGDGAFKGVASSAA